MKKLHLLLILSFIIASCSPSAPIPTKTSIPTATATLAPIPTLTPTVTPEPWLAIMDKYGLPEEVARELGSKEVTIEEMLYGRALKDTTGTVLFEEIRGEWQEAKNYEWVTSIEDFQNSFVSSDEILDGSLYAWVVREVIPNVEFEDEQTDKTKLKFCCDISYFWGYPKRTIKGAAYFHTEVGGRKYRVIVNVYEGENEEKFPVILVEQYIDQTVDQLNKFWNEMSIAPIVYGSTNHWRQGEDPFVAKSQKLMGDDLTLDDIREFIPEKAKEWDDAEVTPPSGSMRALFNLLTPEQQAEFESGTGGLVLAFYGFESGNPSFMSYPGVVFHTFVMGK